MTRRVGAWKSRLITAMDIMEREPHVYGQSDCLMRVGYCAAAMFDDPLRSEILGVLETYRGRYSSLSGAYRVLKKDGLTPISLVTRFFAENNPIDATDGDIGAVKQDGRNWGFGIISGAHFYVATEAGTGILPRSTMQKAFRVE